MLYIAYVVFGFTGIQLTVSFLNFIFRQRVPVRRGYNGLISVLIPVRNEANNIAKLLSDLQALEYKNIEILVFDDQSTDNTREIVLDFCGRDTRFRLAAGKELPDGWLGKAHACYRLSQLARGEYFLFLDADVRVQRNIIERAVLLASKFNLALLSMFPKQVMKTLGEQITVPFMNYILLTLLPLIQVRRSEYKSLSAANGQFMLFRSDIYKEFRPHEVMKNEKVEDIAIARYYKHNRLKIACIASCSDVSCRMYTSFSDAIGGFSKNVRMFFGNSYVLAILFWMITSLGFLPVLFSFGVPGLIILLAMVFLTKVLVSLSSNQSVSGNLVLVVFQHLSLGIVIVKSLQNHYKRQYIWKGRNIS
ncbi:MAG TPA: glycosyltransferase family 2 protein [Bacteroidales bacterium]|nr:glycosyltransferase family 2 protein [Bacteroidales bacterium]